MIRKNYLIYLLLLPTIMAGCKNTQNQNDYLNKVLANLETIQTATYYMKGQPFQHGDTTALFTNYNYIKEYNNPSDTTIGASFVCLESEDTTRLNSCYDGTLHATAFHEHNGIMIDDFTTRDLPFRPLTPPFFNYAKSIVRYVLTTTDSIDTEFNEIDNDYYLKLTIHEDNQIEFFGAPHRIPPSPYDFGDPTSIYEMWISKDNNLPYKIRREMSHDISLTYCSEIKIGTTKVDNISVFDYFPPDYEVRKRERKNVNIRPTQSLCNHKAPQWTLTDMNEKNLSLSDIKSKVVLINFTGIGCGPCKASIPFLKELKSKYNTDDFELIAIESWVGRPNGIKTYTQKNDINYTMLCANDGVLKDYKTERAAPVFFILDEDRIIQKVIDGYSKDFTDKEISAVVQKILGK